MTTSMKNKSTKRVQANVDKQTVGEAEAIMKEMGLTPTTVINALYKKIAATGEIPFSFKLTSEQMATIRLQEELDKVPEHKVRTQKELKEFFDED